MGMGSDVLDSRLRGSMLTGLDSLERTGAAWVGVFEALAPSSADRGDIGLEMGLLASRAGG